MKRKYTVPLGILLLISIVYLCTSLVSFKLKPATDVLEPGSYEMVANGTNPCNLSGKAAYHSIRSVSPDGDVYHQLKLIFTDLRNSGDHSITIYFTHSEQSSPLERGTYYITENISGFINNFEGVFGFADIGKMGELPYFTKKGKIKISESDNKNLSGRLSLVLKNNLGDIVEVEGDFIAYNESAD